MEKITNKSYKLSLEEAIFAMKMGLVIMNKEYGMYDNNMYSCEISEDFECNCDKYKNDPQTQECIHMKKHFVGLSLENGDLELLTEPNTNYITNQIWFPSEMEDKEIEKYIKQIERGIK